MSYDIAVIGAGNWGTALALHLAKKGISVCLWDKNEALIQAIQKDRHNPFYLSQFKFPETLQAEADLEQVIQSSQDVLIATPSHVFEQVLKNLSSYIPLGMRMLVATKGIDPQHHVLLHTLIEKYYSKAIPFAIISGPSFAAEVAAGLPTAIAIASNNSEFQEEMMALFRSPVFRLYPTSDYVGVQIGGAIKNVLAIAVGISDGLGYGANMRAALVTFGMQEMIRLGQAVGAKLETLIGLAGLGDLVLTCTDSQSRNRRFGLALGQGCPIETAEESIGESIEGKKNAAQVAVLAEKYNLELPIVSMVLSILSEEKTAEKALKQLLDKW